MRCNSSCWSQWHLDRMSDQLLRLQKKENNSQEICKRSCRKIKREILSKHGSFFLANLEVIITRISTTKNRWNFRLLQQVLHFEQRIARQRECSLKKEKGKSARNLQDLDWKSWENLKGSRICKIKSCRFLTGFLQENK